jgi:hypothetical protein
MGSRRSLVPNSGRSIGRRELVLIRTHVGRMTTQARAEMSIRISERSFSSISLSIPFFAAIAKAAFTTSSGS